MYGLPHCVCHTSCDKEISVAQSNMGNTDKDNKTKCAQPGNTDESRASIALSNVMSECNQAEEHIRRATSTKDKGTHCIFIQYVVLVRLGL